MNFIKTSGKQKISYRTDSICSLLDRRCNWKHRQRVGPECKAEAAGAQPCGALLTPLLGPGPKCKLLASHGDTVTTPQGEIQKQGEQHRALLPDLHTAGDKETRHRLAKGHV